MAAPEAGSKKLLAVIFPELSLVPVTSDASTLLKLLFDHVALESQELPLLVCPERETWLL
jgi:hypothetical protein